MSALAEPVAVANGGGGWAVRDKGKEALRLPLDQFRVSILWKADVSADEAERLELAKDISSLDEVAAIFDRDLEARGEKLRFDLERFEGPAFGGSALPRLPGAPADRRSAFGLRLRMRPELGLRREA